MTEKTPSKKTGKKKAPGAKILRAGPSKKELRAVKPERRSAHKFRAAWFQERTAWPWREPMMRDLVRARWQASRIPAASGRAQWACVGPSNIGGRLTCITVHPQDADRIIAGAAGGGLWKSLDAG